MEQDQNASLPYMQEVKNQRISKMNISSPNYHLNLMRLTLQVEDSFSVKGKRKGKKLGPTDQAQELCLAWKMWEATVSSS